MTEEMYARAVALRHDLHAHPEGANHETYTKQALMRFIKENTSLEICDMGRYFAAVYRTRTVPPRPPLALRADFEAVPVCETAALPYASKNPGWGHKCGHDGHSAALALTATELERAQPDRDVYLIFQHAEETGEGAAEIVPFVEQNGIREIYATHNWPGIAQGAVRVKEGTVQCASEGMVIAFTGRRSHASMPEEGLNPAEAISRLVISLAGLADRKNYTAMVLCTVICVHVGEEAFGTSPGEGELMLTIRAQLESELCTLRERIKEAARGIAAEYGLGVSFSSRDPFPETANTAYAARRVREACERAGVPCTKMDEPYRASEDFGRLIKAAGEGALFYTGSGLSMSELHTPEFDFPDAIMKNIAAVMIELVKG